MDYIKGVTTRRTRLGVEVIGVHYTADPERGSEWAKRERQKYSSQGAWDREDQKSQALDWVLLDIFAPFRAEYFEQLPFGSLWHSWVHDARAATQQLKEGL